MRNTARKEAIKEPGEAKTNPGSVKSILDNIEYMDEVKAAAMIRIDRRLVPEQ
jgi:hypothetical protein